MKGIALFCVTAALIACSAGRSEAPTTTTSATVSGRPDGGRTLEPVPRGAPEPVWSPAPQPGSSQMPFDPRGFTSP